MSLKVFVSYAKEDRDLALKYYDLLLQEGTAPWMDVKHLLPGQNWEAEIDKAFSDANVVVLLMSKKSVNKRGFVQREANDAIERLRYKQPTDIYVIPLLLEPCDVPGHIAGRLQYVDLNTAGAWEQVQASLKIAAEQQSIELAKGLNTGPFRVFTEKLEEQWHGAPGHDIKIEYPRFEAASSPDIAKDLTLFFAGRATRTLIEARQKPWDQFPDRYPDVDEYRAMNGRWDSFGIVHATPQLLSLAYEVGWYGAGAAHPNSHFETYNFAMQDRLYVLSLEDFFKDGPDAINRISELCIAALCREYWIRMGEKPDDHQLKWFQDGAGPNATNFTNFTVSADHFTFLFAPYQVSAYVMGRWSVDVSFYDLLDALKADGPHLLAGSSRA
ncbi:TIR domain-containing protein [Burkholderia cepacia]|uniref:TIR domain-containing protein n=1 Tax=Burkholderia cepacia TaxID=292 RepID=UPI000CF1BEB9|nr:TIR domain-containing protein [Burkholderia cepacia]KAB1593815.1 TIR domain-containing protein [Burkholderia cepacia]